MRRRKQIEIDPSQCVTVDEATGELGAGFSRSSIMRRITSGEWEEGIHWIDDRRAGTAKRLIKINLAEVNKLRAVPAGER